MFSRGVAPIELTVGGYVDGNRQKDQHGKITGSLPEAWAGIFCGEPDRVEGRMPSISSAPHLLKRALNEQPPVS